MYRKNIMKINSKFTVNLFKSCGLLMPFIVVSSCGSKGKGNNGGKQSNTESGNKKQGNTNVTTSNQSPKTTPSTPAAEEPLIVAAPAEEQPNFDQKKMSEVINGGDGTQHVGIKFNEKFYDLTIFYDLYQFFYNKKDEGTDLVKPEDLTIEVVKKMINKGQFVNDVPNNERNLVNANTDTWKENESNLFEFNFGNDIANNLCTRYNGLLKFLVGANDLGFPQGAFDEISGKLKNGATVNGWEGADVLIKLAELQK